MAASALDSWHYSGSTTRATAHATVIREISLYLRFEVMIDIYTLIVLLFTLNFPSSTAAAASTRNG